MIKDAIVTLKERTGSSQYAIQKFIEEKHKSLPPTFRKLLLVNLKRLVASEKLVKVKASFKIPSARSAATPKPAAPVKKKTTVVAKPKGKVAAAVAPAKAKAAAKGTKKPAAKVVARLRLLLNLRLRLLLLNLSLSLLLLFPRLKLLLLSLRLRRDQLKLLGLRLEHLQGKKLLLLLRKWLL